MVHRGTQAVQNRDQRMTVRQRADGTFHVLAGQMVQVIASARFNINGGGQVGLGSHPQTLLSVEILLGILNAFGAGYRIEIRPRKRNSVGVQCIFDLPGKRKCRCQ